MRRAKFAGVLPPSFPPSFSVVRTPLWTPNTRVSGAADAEASPVFDTSATQNRLYHYRTDGNSYLRQPWHDVMAFEPATTAATAANADVFAFKCFIRPFEVDGRRMIYSTKNTLKSGGIFVDQIDGRVRVGWYDTVQKREVYVWTNVPVLDPYHWHYLYVRKRYPSTSLGSRCWTDTIFGLTAGTLNDVLLVRRFPKVVTAIQRKRTWDYKASATSRNFIGFTTDLEYGPIAGVSATGLVSRANRTFTDGGAGVSGRIVDANATIFSVDMIGMLLALGTGPFAGTSYVISDVLSTTQCEVVDKVDGSQPDLTGLAADPGGVYTGVRLLRSAGFSSSEAVDQADYDIELFGSHLSGDPESGIKPFVGEFGCGFAYGVFNGATPDIFELTGSATDAGIAGDLADDGTDLFGKVQIFSASATQPGSLHAETLVAAAFTAVDTRDYGAATSDSTLPNGKGEVAVVAAASSAHAKPLTWQFIDKPADLSKKRKIRVAFYDPEQAQVSNPSAELVVNPGGDDASNPSGQVSIRLSRLPVSRDSGPIEVWVYMTEPDGDVFHFVASVPSGTSTIAITKSDEQISRGIPLDFDNWAPPECDVLEVVNDALVCGNLRRIVNDDNGVPKDIPDAAVFSKAFVPTAFPAGNIISVADGSRAGITGLRQFNGRLVIAKRDSLHRAAISQLGPATEVISSKIGAASGAALVLHDNVIVFWGKQGIYGYTGSGVPVALSVGKLDGIFRDGGAEAGSALTAVAAVHPKRSQVVLVVRENEAPYTSQRVSVEVDGQGEARFSRYQDPNITALADYATEKAEAGELVGGSEEGFFFWLDRTDTALLALGPALTHGDSALTATAGSTTSKVVRSAGTLDTSLEGPRGAVLRWGTVEAVALFADATTLYLDRLVAAAPASGTALTLGKPTRYWRTRWLDLGVPEATKRMRYLDVIFTVGAGSVTCSARVDFGTTDLVLDSHPGAAATAINLAATGSGEDVGAGFRTFDIGHLHHRFFQFSVASEDPFEIVQFVVRTADADIQ